MPDDIKFMPAVDRDLYGRVFLCPTGREVYQTQRFLHKIKNFLFSSIKNNKKHDNFDYNKFLVVLA
jgi:hypothetical protein